MQDIIVYIIVFLCVVYVGKHLLDFFRSKKKGCGCSCGCSDCPLSAKCKSEKNKTTKK